MPCCPQMLTIVAMLSAEVVFFRPPRRDNDPQNDALLARATEAHLKFFHDLGDHISYLRVFNAWLENGMLVAPPSGNSQCP